ncbi:putative endoribonuclease [Actinocatenispora thailandica]|uniref:Putative endoribonuclease n=2 Tax=Actinocatenispora thailandica TaxID=227318 RepID=A0A7R7HZG5_9ACTN|nr:putative endoribonuclease [Actinocatenispora thailandica]
MGTVADRLAELGLTVPEVAAPVAAYVPALVDGDLVYVSGQLPVVAGELAGTGKVGAEVSTDAAAALARTCAVNCVAALASVVDLERVRQIVKVTGYVASAPGFTDQPLVVNGASELFGAVFGPAGQHARAAVGVAELPKGAPVEIDVIARIAP